MKKPLLLIVLFVAALFAQGPVTRSAGGCVAAGASGTAYTCSFGVAPGTGYLAHQAYFVTADVANTASATWNINGLGIVTIVKNVGGAGTVLAANDIRAGAELVLIYDGTNFQCAVGCNGVTPAAGYSTVKVAGSALTARTAVNLVNIGFSSSADNSGTAATDIRYCDTAVMVCMKDDFMMGGRASSQVFGDLGWAPNGANTVFTTGNLITGHPGVLKIATTASSATNWASMATHTGGFIDVDISAVKFDARFVAALTNTATLIGRLGFNNGFGTRSGTSNGCYFEAASSNWSEVCKSATVATTTSCAVATDSLWHSFRIWATSVGTINFSIDGVACAAAISTNVPVTGVMPYFAIENTTTVAEVNSVDLFEMVITGLTR